VPLRTRTAPKDDFLYAQVDTLVWSDLRADGNVKRTSGGTVLYQTVTSPALTTRATWYRPDGLSSTPPPRRRSTTSRISARRLPHGRHTPMGGTGQKYAITATAYDETAPRPRLGQPEDRYVAPDQSRADRHADHLNEGEVNLSGTFTTPVQEVRRDDQLGRRSPNDRVVLAAGATGSATDAAAPVQHAYLNSSAVSYSPGHRGPTRMAQLFEQRVVQVTTCRAVGADQRAEGLPEGTQVTLSSIVTTSVRRITPQASRTTGRQETPHTVSISGTAQRSPSRRTIRPITTSPCK